MKEGERMKKIVLVILLLGLLILTACNDDESTLVNESINEIENQGDEATSETETVAEEDKINVDELTEIEIMSQLIELDNPYNSSFFDVSIIGAEVYETLESEKYSDIPAEGNNYLVVYLEIRNRQQFDDYFNYNNIVSTADGVDVKTTYLINSPKEFDSIFNTIPELEIVQGCIVYEVPSDWNKLEMVYDGWEGTRGVVLEFEVTSDNLREIEPFGSEHTAPYKGKDD